MQRKLFALVLLAVILTALCFSPAAAEDSGADWVKAMEIHAGLKDLTPLAGCEFKLGQMGQYAPANGVFTSQANIPQQALMDFTMRLYEASKSVSTSGISDLTVRNVMNGVKRSLEDIAQFKLDEFDQIGWSYAYDAGAQSKIKGSAKYVLITIDDVRSVSLQVGED